MTTLHNQDVINLVTHKQQQSWFSRLYVKQRSGSLKKTFCYAPKLRIDVSGGWLNFIVIRRKHAPDYKLPRDRSIEEISSLISESSFKTPLSIVQDSKIVNNVRIVRRSFEPNLRYNSSYREKKNPSTSGRDLSNTDYSSSKLADDIAQGSIELKILSSSIEACQLPSTSKIEMSNDQDHLIPSSSSMSSRKLDYDPLDSSNSTYKIIEQGNFLGLNHLFILSKNPEDPTERLAVKIRTGISGYQEWMSELQVYLLPNFKHKNILDYYGSDQRRCIDKLDLPCIDELNKEVDKDKELGYGASPSRIEYWLINRFTGCRILRDYLKEHVLEWAEMLRIAKGIAEGLYFLHENIENQNINRKKLLDGYLKSTRGAIKEIRFKSSCPTIHMKPTIDLSIIHRNLSSITIILKADMTPCIWNFGNSYIHYPFQPINNKHLISRETRIKIRKNPYSSPELLLGTVHRTLPDLKSIDLYALGVVYWELISRCSLPEIMDSSNFKQERIEPARYYEPLERELKGRASSRALISAVCHKSIRPKIEEYWTAGKVTQAFVRILQDLWDHDSEARISSSTVLQRLNRIYETRCDYYNRFRPLQPNDNFNKTILSNLRKYKSRFAQRQFAIPRKVPKELSSENGNEIKEEPEPESVSKEKCSQKSP